MPLRLPARQTWTQLAALMLFLPGLMQQAADPALVELKRGDAFYTEAMKHFDAKNWTLGNDARVKGIASYKKAIELNPKLFEAHRRLADLARRNTTLAGNLQVAAESYKKALEIKPDAETASRLGITYVELRRTAEAVAPFEMAVRLDPKVAMFQYNLGFAHAELSNLDEARKILARLSTMDSTLARKLREKIEPAEKQG
jgi:tetratricopeptide (TPR) repeat protein